MICDRAREEIKRIIFPHFTLYIKKKTCSCPNVLALGTVLFPWLKPLYCTSGA